MEDRKLNRLETTRKIGPLIDRHWAGLVEAKARGEKVAWCTALIYPLAYAVGMKAHFHAGYCAYVAGRGFAPMLLEEAETSQGHLVDTCSYHRVHMGLASLIINEKPIPEPARLPIPDVLLAARLCTEHTHQSDSLYRYFKTEGLEIPLIAVDLVGSHRVEDIELNRRFIRDQIYEVVIPNLERLSGKKFDYDELSEIVLFIKQTAILRNECVELMKHKPAPATIFDLSVSMAPTIYLFSPEVRKDALDYYHSLKAEMQERIANGIGGVIPAEEYRIFWDGFILWGWVGVMARKLTRFGANGILGRYAPMELYPHPEEMDPEHPVESLVDQWANHMTRGSTPEQANKLILQWVKDYSIDALIMHSSRTCRFWNIGQQDILSDVERKLGLPGILLEADMLDPKFFSEAQIDTRLQALFEMVDARRQAWH